MYVAHSTEYLKSQSDCPVIELSASQIMRLPNHCTVLIMVVSGFTFADSWTHGSYSMDDLEF